MWSSEVGKWKKLEYINCSSSVSLVTRIKHDRENERILKVVWWLPFLDNTMGISALQNNFPQVLIIFTMFPRYALFLNTVINFHIMVIQKCIVASCWCLLVMIFFSYLFRKWPRDCYFHQTSLFPLCLVIFMQSYLQILVHGMKIGHQKMPFIINWDVS